MGKYEPLAQHLGDHPMDYWDASFSEIEEVLGFDLPPSARNHQSWWGNSYRGNHSQAKGWIGAGWEVDEIDLKNERVRLRRTPLGGRKAASSEIADLWRNAQQVSGIHNRAELESLVLKKFIEQQSLAHLIELGGAMKDAEAPPRRRFE